MALEVIISVERAPNFGELEKQRFAQYQILCCFFCKKGHESFVRPRPVSGCQWGTFWTAVFSAIPFDQKMDFFLNLLREGVLSTDQATTQLGPIDRPKGNSQVQLTRP